MPGVSIKPQATTLQDQAAGYQDIVQAMTESGWGVTEHNTVQHGKFGHYPDWAAAVRACVHVASGA